MRQFVVNRGGKRLYVLVRPGHPVETFTTKASFDNRHRELYPPKKRPKYPPRSLRTVSAGLPGLGKR